MLGVVDYLIVIFLIVVIVTVSVLPSLLRPQFLLPFLPLVLFCLPLPLSLGVIHRPHGQILWQRSQEIYKDEVPRLVPPSQC